MKKSTSIILLLLLCFSCSEENINNLETNSYNNKVRGEIIPINNCNLYIQNEYSINLTGYIYPMVEFNWSYTYDSDCSYITNAFFEIKDPTSIQELQEANGNCSYNFIHEVIPIDDFYNTNSLTLNINQLTDNPLSIYNPYNPPSYENLIYGSKCFYWRIVAEGVYCQQGNGLDDNDQLCSKKIVSDWKFFQY